MTVVTKFYDADVADNGGGQSIAELMAHQGVRNNTDDMVATPIQIGGTRTETEVKDATPAATATEQQETKVEEKVTPNATQEQAVVQTPQKEVEQPKVLTLQEVLKNEQPDTVLKGLGFDEKVVDFIKDLKDLDPKMVAFFNTWKNEGDVKSYLKELSTDYSKMAAEELMRHQLRLEYPNANEKTLEVLFKNEVVKKYNLDSEDEVEAEEGKLLLEAKADKYREEFIAKQNDYLLPKAPQKQEQTVNVEEEKTKAAIENVVKQFNEDSYTKSILTDGAISFGDGDEKFSFKINANEVIDLAINGDKDGSLMFDISKDQSGNEVYKPKTQHQILVATVSKYGMDFLNEYAKHYKALGGKAAIEPIDNAKPSGDNQRQNDSQTTPKTIAEAMAKQGVYSSGGR